MRVRPAVPDLSPRARGVSLLVSIHDVTPALEPGVRRLWEMCAARGIAPALLVVPDWHGGWPLERSSGLRRVASRRGGARRRDRAARRAAFAWRVPVARGRGGERADSARRRPAPRASASPRADSFRPPGWRRKRRTRRLGTPDSASAEDAHAVRLLPSGRRVRSPAVRWSARSAVRAWGSVLVARGPLAPPARCALSSDRLPSPGLRSLSHHPRPARHARPLARPPPPDPLRRVDRRRSRRFPLRDARAVAPGGHRCVRGPGRARPPGPRLADPVDRAGAGLSDRLLGFLRGERLSATRPAPSPRSGSAESRPGWRACCRAGSPPPPPSWRSAWRCSPPGR